MKTLAKLLPLFLFSLVCISCATTKVFDMDETEIVSKNKRNNDVHYIRTVEHVEAKYEPNVSMIMFDCLGMPFLVTGCFLRETGRVMVYSVGNIPLGFVDGMCPPCRDSINGVPIEPNQQPNRWMPDVEAAQQVLDEFNKKFEDTNYIKYKKYTKHWSKTTLNIKKIVEEVKWDGTTNVLQSETFTLIFVDTVSDSIERVSKKSSLTGKKIGKTTAKIVSAPTYYTGRLIGKAFEK